ncbi:hypothetical protein ABMA27_011882 [Loxostege sticticalis]|uniref:RNA-directed DNA polymerase from mobile element jockey n=1 Tax=Loxostege sticticalis TaxID=481309 RepID=A0ABR3IHW6_LOXSC
MTDPPDPGEPLTVPPAASFVTVESQESETDHSTPPRKRVKGKKSRRHQEKIERRHRSNDEVDESSLPSQQENMIINNGSDLPRLQLTPKANSSDLPRSQPTPIARNLYNESDSAPYVVHVQKIEKTPNEGSPMHALAFGKFLKQNSFQCIVNGSVKQIGRSKISISFSNFNHANLFLTHNSLVANNYKAFIPSFNVTRMGLVRGIPAEWSPEEIMENITVPDDCGKIIKVRRLNYKTFVDGNPLWKPSQSIVLTFDGQVLPKRIFMCYNALPVELYIFPTIQCYNCCRFGHTKLQCRSKPRCFKCGQDHAGETCQTDEIKASCCLCTGYHYATSKSCPEFLRQKNIKTSMANNSMSYAEASKVHPPISKSYADTLISKPDKQLVSEKSTNSSVSYKKTVFLKPPINVYNMCIVSLYIPHPSFHIIDNVINHLFSVLPRPFLVLGDFNCHHQSWGCPDTNSYGENLIDVIDRLNICVLNTGKPTRLSRPGQNSSAVDLSISTPSLATLLSWDTLGSTFGSDHFPIMITFPFSKTLKSNHTSRLRYNLPNKSSDIWEKYRNCVERRVSSLPVLNPDNQILCANAFAHILIDAANEVFPKKSNSPTKIPSPPWWDAECTLAIKKRKQAEIIYKGNMNEDNFNTLSQITANTRKLFKQKKFEGWRKFCDSISPNTPPTLVWRNIKRFRSAMSDSSFNTIPESLADEFLNKLAPPWVSEHISLFPSSPEEPSGLNSPFSLNELKGVILNTKDSAPGSDGISYSFLANIPDRVLCYYLAIINDIMLTGVIPPSWKSQIVLPILKPGKSPSDASSYRPIALSSVLLKLAEHLVKNRLEWYVESNRFLADSQFGFRKGRCTLDSISLFISDIRRSFTINESVVAVFLDINSAYDNVILSVLKTKLDTLRVPYVLSNFILRILTERCIVLPVGDSEINRFISRGLPQGSVLSPLLYNIYTYDLESSLNSNVNILQYADDLLLYYSSYSIAHAQNTLSYSLDLLKNWMDNNGMNLSVSKSAVVIFSRKRILPPLQLYYDYKVIPVVDEHKFLGVILDCKLTGVPHCNFVSVRCEKVLNLLRCLSGVWWGAHPYSMKLIYNALIRSILDYGTFLLEPANKSAFKKLDLIQHKALRIVTGAMRSSPTNALQVETCDPPLHLRRQLLSDRFLFRVIQSKNHPLIPKLQALNEMITDSYWAHRSLPCLLISYHKFLSLSSPTHRSNLLPLFSNSFETLTFSPNIHYNLLDKSDPCIKYTFKYVVDTEFNDYHHIYSDASKHSPSGCVGIGVYHAQSKIVQKVKLPPESSVFTGECFGLFKAIEYVRIMKLEKAIIFSDSMSALQALEKFPFHLKSFYPIIFDIRKIAFECLQNGYSIHFAWLPGHCGIHGNETADCLANDAIECGDMFPFKNFSHDLLSLPKIDLYDTWSNLWQSTSQHKGRLYSLIQPQIPRKPWYFKATFGKNVTSMLIRMRLGHVCTPVHLARLHILDTSICECGLDEGDLNHIFFSCPLNDHCSFLENLISLDIPLPTSIISLLHSNDLNVYKLICNFIIVNNIKI